MKLSNLLCTAITILVSMSTMAQNEIKLVVGTYTRGTSKGIYSFNFNQQTGKATPLDVLEIQNPSFLTISKDGRHIYSVSENGDKSEASVNAIAFNSKTGKMKLINSQLTYGEDPCYIETNGNLLLTANYTGGSMSVFRLNANGSICPLSQLFLGSTAPSDKQQQSTPHVHCTRFSPDGKYVLATNFSANQLLRYKFRDKNTLMADGVAGQLRKNSGCRHFIWSKDRRFVYVMSEISGAVSVFKNGIGEMKRIQDIQSDSVGGEGGADMHLSKDGRFLYASNRLKADGISIFKVNTQTGLLTKVGYQLTGIHPRHFNITPNGKFLLCACRDSNTIQVYRIDPKTGLLTDTHQNIDVDKAVCIQFY